MNKKVFAAPAMFVLVAAIVAMTTPVNAVYAGGHNGGHHGHGHYKGGNGRHDHDGHNGGMND